MSSIENMPRVASNMPDGATSLERHSLSSDELPRYSENPAYESVPVSHEATRRAVRDHEKKVRQDLKSARYVEEQCARIKQILPQVYVQLCAAVDAPRVARQRTGPAALRPRQEPDGIEVNFKSRGIDQKALRLYLPALLVEYHRQVESQQRTGESETLESEPTGVSDLLSRSESAPMETTDAGSQRPRLRHAVTTSTRAYDADKMRVSAGYFDDYTQKIYFSRRFVNLWKKENGKRENLASGVAMVLIGLKMGLPLFDLVTFVALDLPRLALQGITGKQTLKLRD